LATKSITVSDSLLELVTETEAPNLEENTTQSPNQLNLLNEFEHQANNFKPETKKLMSSTRVELAERFGVKLDTLGNRVNGKMASTFSEWSKKKDPDGITWQYYPETKLFLPLIETVTNSEIEVVSEKLNTTTQDLLTNETVG